MFQQKIPAGGIQRVVIAELGDDLSVRGWDEQAFRMDADSQPRVFQSEGDTLHIAQCDEAVALWVPFEATVSMREVRGDVSVEGVRRVELDDVDGDVRLERINGDVMGGELRADVTAQDVQASMHIEDIEGDAAFTNIAGGVKLREVGGDLSASGLGSLEVGNVGSDVVIRNCANAGISLGNVGSDLQIIAAQEVRVGNVGSDCDIRDVGGDVMLGQVGSDAKVQGVGNNLHIGNVGSDAHLRGVHGGISVGNIGSDLILQADFPSGSATSLRVGGDAVVMLPDAVSLSIRAQVGGDIKGRSLSSSSRGNSVVMTYGDGAATLELFVGGDLVIKGNAQPSSQSSGNAWGSFTADFEQMGHDFEHMGEQMSRDFERMGQEFERGFGRGMKMKGKMKEKSKGPSAQMHVRVNDREWRFDQERLNRIIEQAQRAAAEGVQGAMEAVEQALSNLKVPMPPTPPYTPHTPTPPMPPEQPFTQSAPSTQAQQERNAPEVPATPDAGQSAQRASTAEQEREAILRMIAEGRISPEEGDMLLEALE